MKQVFQAPKVNQIGHSVAIVSWSHLLHLSFIMGLKKLANLAGSYLLHKILTMLYLRTCFARDNADIQKFFFFAVGSCFVRQQMVWGGYSLILIKFAFKKHVSYKWFLYSVTDDYDSKFLILLLQLSNTTSTKIKVSCDVILSFWCS